MRAAATALALSVLAAACSGQTPAEPIPPIDGSPAPTRAVATTATIATSTSLTTISEREAPSEPVSSAGPIEPDPGFVLRYVSPASVDMRSNPFGSAGSGTFPSVFAAHLYRVLPPTFTLVPELAADDEPPPVAFDGSGWVVSVALNEGLTWSDGERIDAFDVQYTFEDVVRFGVAEDHGWIVEDPAGQANLLSVTALDTATVEFRFDGRPALDRWHFGLATASILPEHFWVFTFADRAPGRETDAGLGMTAPSAGGFRFGSVSDDGTWVWAAVEDWWNSGAQYTVYENGAVMYRNPRLGLEEIYSGPAAGDVVADWTEGPYAAAVRWSASEGNQANNSLIPEEADLLVGGPDLGLDVPIPGEADRLISEDRVLTAVAFNPEHPALARSGARMAISCLIDPSFLAEGPFQGAPSRAGWAVPSGLWRNDRFDDPCAAEGPARFEAAVDLLRSEGWQWEVEPVLDAVNGVVESAGLSHPDVVDTAIVLLGPPESASVPAAVTTLWIESWLEGIGFSVLVVEGDAHSPEAPRWDVAVVLRDTVPLPRPFLASNVPLLHLEAETLSQARPIWAATRAAIAAEGLAMPLFVWVRLDLVSPAVSFPYRHVRGGLDPAVVATAVTRSG